MHFHFALTGGDNDYFHFVFYYFFFFNAELQMHGEHCKNDNLSHINQRHTPTFMPD